MTTDIQRLKQHILDVIRKASDRFELHPMIVGIGAQILEAIETSIVENPTHSVEERCSEHQHTFVESEVQTTANPWLCPECSRRCQCSFKGHKQRIIPQVSERGMYI